MVNYQLLINHLQLIINHYVKELAQNSIHQL